MDYSMLIAIEKSLNPKEYLHLENKLVVRDSLAHNQSFMLGDDGLDTMNSLNSVDFKNTRERANKKKKIAIGNWMSERHRF